MTVVWSSRCGDVYKKPRKRKKKRKLGRSFTCQRGSKPSATSRSASQQDSRSIHGGTRSRASCTNGSAVDWSQMLRYCEQPYRVVGIEMYPAMERGEAARHTATDADLEHVLLTPDAAIRVSMSAKTFEGQQGLPSSFLTHPSCL